MPGSGSSEARAVLASVALQAFLILTASNLRQAANPANSPKCEPKCASRQFVASHTSPRSMYIFG